MKFLKKISANNNGNILKANRQRQDYGSRLQSEILLAFVMVIRKNIIVDITPEVEIACEKMNRYSSQDC